MLVLCRSNHPPQHHRRRLLEDDADQAATASRTLLEGNASRDAGWRCEQNPRQMYMEDLAEARQLLRKYLEK